MCMIILAVTFYDYFSFQFFVCLFVIFAILLGVGIWAVVAKEDVSILRNQEFTVSLCYNSSEPNQVIIVML